MEVRDEERLLEVISHPPQQYDITKEDIQRAISKRSPFYCEYVAGMHAINGLDMAAVMQISEDIRLKTMTLEDDIQRSYVHIKTGMDYLFSHSMNVALLLAPFFCWWEGFSVEHGRDAIAGAIVHDIGKLYVPKEVLSKKGRLTPEERILIEQHPALGYLKLRELLGVKDVSHLLIPLMAYQHHENNDGTGYPEGLRKKDIIPEAKMLHVVDVYEAMTAARCYKPAESPTDATEYLMSQYGKMFSPTSLRLFMMKSPAYKEGDCVILSDDRHAKVLKTRNDAPLRPKVKICDTGEIIDLTNDMSALNIVIKDKVSAHCLKKMPEVS